MSPSRRSDYGPTYQRERRALLAVAHTCALRLVCDGAVAETADHVPPLSQHRHRPGTGCCHLQPACWACQRRQGKLLGLRRYEAPRTAPDPTRQW